MVNSIRANLLRQIEMKVAHHPTKMNRGKSVSGSSRRKWLLLLLPFALIPFLAATKLPQDQTKPPQDQAKPTPERPKPDIKSVVKVVNVLATVRDKKGAIVRNLTKDDFVLTEEGNPQTIKYFIQENDLPLTVGLLVDTSLSQRRVLGAERTASFSFLDHTLHEEKDRAFVIHFDREVEMLQDLTISHKRLQ